MDILSVKRRRYPSTPFRFASERSAWTMARAGFVHPACELPVAQRSPAGSGLQTVSNSVKSANLRLESGDSLLEITRQAMISAIATLGRP